eukprot:jgi/Phyca11/100361/e_gw1.4.918.1
MVGSRQRNEEPSKAHLSAHDYEVLVDWIEIKSNYVAIYGTDRKPSVGGAPKQKKLSAFEDMAKYLALNSRNERLPRLSGEQMQNRWRTYMKKFRSTLNLSKTGTGFGLSQREMGLGLSVDDKLEQKCPQFHRMNEIFGEVPSIKPAKTLELG